MTNQLQLVLPDVEKPAITQAQFDYDMNRSVEDAVLENPMVLAFMARNHGERISALEGKVSWLTQQFQKLSRRKSAAE